jgi:hypothetical protein
MVVKAKSSAGKSEPKKQGNYVDTFVKRMFSRIMVFADFLTTYADSKFVSEIDLKRIALAPTHYIGHKGDERITDLAFLCPLKNGDGRLTAVIIFEHENSNLKRIPHKLLKYATAIWDAEIKEGKKILSAPYFLVLRTGKKQLRVKPPTLAASLPKGSDGKPLGHVPEFQYDIVDLPAWDFDKLVGDTVLRLVLGMLHKMTGGNLDEFPDALKPLREITNEKKRIELTKELMDFVDKAFKAHNRRLDAVEVRKALNTIFEGKGDTMIKSCFDEKFDEGVAVGKAEEKTETGRNLVLKALRRKFGKIPKGIEKAVLTMTDPIALESVLEHVIDSNTLDEFSTIL